MQMSPVVHVFIRDRWTESISALYFVCLLSLICIMNEMFVNHLYTPSLGDLCEENNRKIANNKSKLF